MRFAVVSDVHGNLPALNAVIEDAERECVDYFIFIGDYCLSNPWPDECITRIKSLNKKYGIRGNEEKYIENLIGKDQSTWTDGQMQISYWCYRKISPENRDFLLSLPAYLELTFHDVTMHIAHSSADFIMDSEHKEWGTARVAERYQEKFLSPSAFREDIRKYLDNDRQFQERLEDLSDGIYIFGHTHIQWNYQSDDGKKLLINPGSCGLPLDCIDEGVPYTLLDISQEGKIEVGERRVPFSKDRYLDVFLKSEQFEKANVWSKVIVKELKTNREHLFFFLRFAEDYARKIGDAARPFSVSTWEKAYKLWQQSLEDKKEHRC